MKNLLGYYVLVAGILLAAFLSPQEFSILPRPQVPSLQFPSSEQTFSPSLPVLRSGSIPLFPQSDIILQPQLFAPFVVLRGQDLSGKNLSKAHFLFADLRQTQLSRTDLSDAILYGANLSDATFDSTTKLPFSRETALSLGMKEVR